MDFIIQMKLPNSMQYSLLFLFLTFSSTLCAFFGTYRDYKAQKAFEKGDYKTVQEHLEKQQVENPFDEQINFNLGSVYYKQKKYNQAAPCFERVVTSSTNLLLQEKSYFNWANTMYQQAISSLPSSWQKKRIDKDVLQKALAAATQSLEKFENTLVVNNKQKGAPASARRVKTEENKKKAEELRDQLQQKLEEQQQKDKKQDQQQDKNKQKNEQQDQQKQDNQQQSQDSQGDGQQRGDQQQPQQQKSNQKQQEQETGQEGDQEQKQQGGQEQGEPENSGHDEQHGTDGELSGNGQDDGYEKKDESAQDEGEMSEEQESAGQAMKEKEETTGEQEGSVGNGPKDESFKERGMKVLLDRLQSEEAQLHKRMIALKSKGSRQPMFQGQNPW